MGREDQPHQILNHPKALVIKTVVLLHARTG